MYKLVEVQSCEGHEDKAWALAWHRSGQIIATCSSDKKIRIWAPAAMSDEGLQGKFECKDVLDGSHTRTVRSLAWKPNT